MRRIYFSLIALSLTIVGCEDVESPRPQVVATSDVVILNEGNFGQGNATIDLYNSTDQSYRKDVFRSNNQGRPIGDVVQSMSVEDNLGYIVVNNSQKVEIVDLATFKSVGAIQGLNSPRYFLSIGSDKAYVSDLYEDAIQIVSKSQQAIVGRIPTGGWSEKMVKIGDTVYVTDMTKNQLLRIDSKADTIMSHTQLIRQPSSLVVDKNDRLWVMCTGGFDEVKPTLYQLSTSGNKIKEFEFQSLIESPGSLVIADNGEDLFYLNQGVYHLHINDTTLENTPIVPENGRLLYSLAIHPKSSELYVADAIDYQQNGIVYRYTQAGQLITQFKAGIIPGSFEFLP